MGDINAAEKQMGNRQSFSASSHEKTGIAHEETAHEAAARGIAATDQLVASHRSLFQVC